MVHQDSRSRTSASMMVVASGELEGTATAHTLSIATIARSASLSRSQRELEEVSKKDHSQATALVRPEPRTHHESTRSHQSPATQNRTPPGGSFFTPRPVLYCTEFWASGNSWPIGHWHGGTGDIPGADS